MDRGEARAKLRDYIKAAGALFAKAVLYLAVGVLGSVLILVAYYWLARLSAVFCGITLEAAANAVVLLCLVLPLALLFLALCAWAIAVSVREKAEEIRKKRMSRGGGR